MKFIAALLTLLLLQALDAHAATLDVSTGGAGTTPSYSCSDDGETRQCTCTGLTDCYRMLRSHACREPYEAPEDYVCNDAANTCTCTWVQDRASDDGHRPGYQGTDGADVATETEEAVRPTEMVPMTGGVMLGETAGGTQAFGLADGSVRNRDVADGSSNTVMLGQNAQGRVVVDDDDNEGATLSMTAPRRDHREDASEGFSSVLEAMLSEALRREAVVDHRGDGADVPRHSNDEPLSESGRPNHTVPARPATLAAPTNLFVAPAGVGALILMWTDNATSEFGVRVERTIPREVRGETYFGWEEAFVSEERVGERVRGTGDRNDIDEGLFSDATYCYRIRAYRGETVSEYSNVACRDVP